MNVSFWWGILVPKVGFLSDVLFLGLQGTRMVSDQPITAHGSRAIPIRLPLEEEVSNNEKALQSAQALREKQVTEFKSDFKEPWG